MNVPFIRRFSIIGLLVSSLASTFATAAELKIFAAVAMPAITADLVPKLEGATGHKLVITTDAFPGLMKRIEAGETADVILLPAPGIAALVKQGKAAEGDVP